MPNVRLYLRILFLLAILSFQNCGTVLLLNAHQSTGEDHILESIIGNMTAGLIHYWPLNGDAKDKVGSLHLTAFGTIGPTLTLDRYGLPNSAFHYDGIDSWHSSDPGAGEPILTGTASFTFSAWVKGKFIPTQGGGIIMGQGDGLGFQLMNDVCLQVRVYTTNQGTGVVSNVSPCGVIVQDDAWYHITFTWDFPNNRANLYIGNDLVTSAVYNPNLPWTSGTPFTLGYGTIGGGSQVVTIDEVRIYNRIVSPADIGF
ncbi:LamG domain-containing protein [Leptospira sarikeiensis]|uniref:LamG domain-containing protein n=1 Tax=Leptospira sarikeiensis TaxID=2484943 RepID=A0A4R9K721_9LEPT|nr:LamG domain-containing protein [Leptospira sarikeiensis]TGL62078.1 LamG domain-containing protein [Leptospira sarikeiensis]